VYAGIQVHMYTASAKQPKPQHVHVYVYVYVCISLYIYVCKYIQTYTNKQKYYCQIDSCVPRQHHRRTELT
jgi:hypothetical protein